MNIPRNVNNVYFNFPEDFIVKINNVEISTSNANNNTNNNSEEEDMMMKMMIGMTMMIL